MIFNVFIYTYSTIHVVNILITPTDHYIFTNSTKKRKRKKKKEETIIHVPCATTIFILFKGKMVRNGN